MTACKLNDNITNFPQFLRASPSDTPALCPWNPLGIFVLRRIAPRLLGDRRPWVVQTKRDNIMSLGIISFLLYFCNSFCHYCSYSLSRYMVVNFVCHVCMTDNRWTNTRTKSPTTELSCSLHLVHDSCRWGDLCQSWMWTMARWEDCFVQHVD